MGVGNKERWGRWKEGGKTKKGYTKWSSLPVEGGRIVRKSFKITRIYYENFNSLNSTNQWKLDRLQSISRCLDVDMVCGTEPNLNWTRVHSQSVTDKVLGEQHFPRASVSHNTHENFHTLQRGGYLHDGKGQRRERNSHDWVG